jgi:hypothetical protein
MKACREIQDLLPLWVGQDLSSEQEAAVTEHLSGCANCRAAAEAWRQDHRRLVAAVAGDQGPALPPERLAAAVDRAAGHRPQKARRTLPLWQVAGPLAAVLALVIIWLGISPTQPDPGATGIQGSVSWAQLQDAFDGCLGEPLAAEDLAAASQPGGAGPAVVAVLLRDQKHGRFVVADCLETADLTRLTHYPWLKQRLDRYRQQHPLQAELVVAVCPTDEVDRGIRRALQKAVLARFTPEG